MEETVTEKALKEERDAALAKCKQLEEKLTAAMSAINRAISACVESEEKADQSAEAQLKGSQMHGYWVGLSVAYSAVHKTLSEWKEKQLI